MKTAKDQILADAIASCMMANKIIVKQRRAIICMIIVIIGLAGGYFFI